MKPTRAQARHFIDSCLGHAPSRWDNPLYKKAAIIAFRRAQEKLLAGVSTDPDEQEEAEEFLARAQSVVRATLGA